MSTIPYLSDICAFVAVIYLLLNDIFCEGDVNSIIIGSSTNIQDNSLVHVAKSNLSGKVLPTIIGDNVTVGEWIWYVIIFLNDLSMVLVYNFI